MTRFSEHAQASMRTLVCWAFCCSLWKGPARAWGRLRVSKWHPRIYIYIYIYACIYIYAWSSTYSDFVCGLRSTLGGLMVGISTGDSVCMIAVMSVSTCIWIAYVYTFTEKICTIVRASCRNKHKIGHSVWALMSNRGTPCSPHDRRCTCLWGHAFVMLRLLLVI